MHLSVASELYPVKSAAWHQYKQAIRESDLLHRENHLNESTKLTVGHMNNWLNHNLSWFSWPFLPFSTLRFLPPPPSPPVFCSISQVSVVNALDMQVVVSTVPPSLVEEKKEELIR